MEGVVPSQFAIVVVLVVVVIVVVVVVVVGVPFSNSQLVLCCRTGLGR